VHGIWADLVPAGAAAQSGGVQPVSTGAGGQPLNLSTFLKPGLGGPAGGI
jgi:hypothetical protein